MDDFLKNKKAADELQDSIIQAAVKFVGRDPTRTLLAITATLNAGIHLVRSCNMPASMRLDFAKMVSEELNAEANNSSE